jgi:MFS family permease
VGLAVGAALYEAAIGLPFGVNAASFAIAAALIATIAVPKAIAQPVSDEVAAVESPGLVAGLRWLWRHRMLRTLAAMVAASNVGMMLSQGVFAKYAVDELGLSTSSFAILLAMTAIGAATGGLLGHRVVAALGMRSAVVLPYLVFGVGDIVLGVSPVAWLSGIACFVLGAAITIWNVVTMTLRQRLIPPELFGRVNGAFQWLAATACAASMVLGGVLAHATTVRMPYFVGGAITLVTAALFARPVLAGLDES